MVIKYLTLSRFVCELHSLPSVQGPQGREGQLFNILVGHLKEVVSEGHFHLFCRSWPLQKVQFFFDLKHVLEVWAVPVSQEMIEEGVL